jgi:integrase
MRFPNIQKEVRHSLNTSNRQEAKRLAVKLYMQTTIEFQNALENLATIEDALKFASGVLTLESNLPDTERNYLNKSFNILISENRNLLKKRFLQDITNEERKCLDSLGKYISLIAQCDFESESELDLFPFYTDKLTDIVNNLVIRINRAVDQGIHHTEVRNRSRDEKKQSHIGNKFSEVCDEYTKERLAGNNWEIKTQKAYEATFHLFEKIIGNIPIDGINASTCRDFKSDIRKLPKNHSKDSRYRELSIQELLKRKIREEDLLSIESVNKHIGRLSSFLNWCVQQSFLERNYSTGMQIRVSKAGIDRREPFTVEELNRLFTDPIFNDGEMKNNYYFWLPLIALYSGARIQEICQLELKDIYEKEGVLIFDVNADSASKRLKNANSVRVIPVHNYLIEVGVLKYIQALKKHGKKVLFPELNKNADGREGQSQPASKWFARYKLKHGFQTNRVKVFHSFRHNFINELNKLDVRENIAATIVGHEHEPITYGTYGGRAPVEFLNEIVQKIEYAGFDTSKIKWHSN